LVAALTGVVRVKASEARVAVRIRVFMAVSSQIKVSIPQS
jgi:hypothetical protein